MGNSSGGRRVVRYVAVAGLLTVAFAGCGEPSDTGAEGSAGRPAPITDAADIVLPATGAARDGGTLRVGLDAESRGFDPTSSQLAASGTTVARTIFDPLVMIGADRDPHPYLAESLTPSDDARTWDIRLRAGIRFHDGAPLDAAALETFLDEARTGTLAGQVLRPIRSVEVTDPLTVRVTMDRPWATFPFVLAQPSGLVAAPSQLASPDGPRHPVGTGPYRFRSWEPDRSLVVERNPDYWRPGTAHLDAIDFRPIPDNQVRYLALRSGDIDLMVTPREPIGRDLVADARAGRAQVVQARGDKPVNLLMLNLSKPPFDDARLRQAVALAIDRDQIAAANDTPPELAAYGIYEPGSPWHVDTAFPRYDPARSAQLVQQVVAERGPLDLTLDTLPDVDAQKTVTVVQSLLHAVGLEVKVDTTEQAGLVNKVIKGDYQVAAWRQFGTPDPDLNYVWWHSASADGPMALNMPRNRDPDIDAALVDARSSSDREVRRKAYAKVQERLSVDLPYIWLTHVRYTLGSGTRVRGIDGGTLPDGSRGVALENGVVPLTGVWLDS
jgi:peptide/nickel transport system substrate-binding protein